MSRTEGRNLRVVLYEGPGSTPLADQDRYQVLSSLLDNGFEVTRPIAGQEVAPPDDAPVLVLGLLDGEPRVTADHEVHFRNLAQVNALDAAREVREATGARTLDAWKPWFPVIDYDRCTNCMQCLTFCLFDVYGVDAEQKITVQNQDNCKTDCPACSRVCPEVAILFPKYGKGPINGDVVREQDIQREAMKVDISTLLGGDLYGSLRTRQREARKRFSTERDESKALLERKRCLGKLKKELDIPDEVLMTLPSAEDIEERAARAKAKLAKRQARSQTVNDSRPAPSETEWGI
ncbi:MAG: ferredoxin family protein [Gemmatimonadetes bacterium]|nr:ferredoxin family protein [Gemmatimonadota bacterium]